MISRERATELRAAFDRGFAEPPPERAAARREVLRIRLAGELHVIPLAAIASIHLDLRVEPVPTASALLLGVATVRSSIIAVYDLRRVVGLPATAPPRWSVVAAGHERAFAFDGFDGLVRVDGDQQRHPIIDLGAIHVD